MSKGKKVKTKHYLKSRSWRKSNKLVKADSPRGSMMSISKSELETAIEAHAKKPLGSDIPISVDDSFLVLWDDGSEGVCHYIKRESLKIIDGSDDLTHGTKVSYLYNGRDWTGRIPSSMNDLIECCCMETAVVDIRDGICRQVLVLWDNPSAGVCHYMYTKDLRIIDNSHRIGRGTRVAMRMKGFTWEGQVPPAIYKPDERGSFILKLKSHANKNLVLDTKDGVSVATGQSHSPLNEDAIIDDYAIANKFWAHIDQFCRNITAEDVDYIENRIMSYHKRNRLRSKLFLDRKRGKKDFKHLKAECQTKDEKETSTELNGITTTFKGKLTDDNNEPIGELELANLTIDVMETDSSLGTYSSTLSSSFADSTPTTNEITPRGDSTDHEEKPNAMDISENQSLTHDNSKDKVVDSNSANDSHSPTILSVADEHPLEDTVNKENQDLSKEEDLKYEYVLSHLREPVSEGMKSMANAIIGRHTERRPLVPPALEDFITSDESLAFDADDTLDEDGNPNDEVMAAIRKKRNELMVIERKNCHALQAILRNMQYAIERQKIEARLTAINTKIANLTGDLMKVFRLKHRRKLKYRLQILKNKEEAVQALAEREVLMKELHEFDSMCSVDLVNLSD